MMRKSKSKNLRDHAEDWATDLAERTGQARDAARVKAGPYLADARAKAAPVLADAREKAGPVLADARQKVNPVLEDARQKAGPVLDDAKHRFSTDVLPVLTAAVAAADEATEEVRSEGIKRGRAAAAALRGDLEPPPAKKRHRLRKALLVLGLGGILAAVAKRLSDRPATSTWQSSYSPPPAPAAPSSEASGGAHRAEDESEDQGGSSPDVIAADNAAEPHAATTPDNPAETVDVSKQ